MKNKLRIANAGGFWGDDLSAFKRQLEGGELDYITMDFLAEITMSILRKQQLRNPELGYVTDFVDQIEESAELIKERNVKVITNAGGINPGKCGRIITEILKRKNVDLKVAVVDGDNIADDLSEYYPEKESFVNLETEEKFENIKSRVQSANVYLGIPPIVKALELGADIIVCGRVTDTSITIAPMVFEFGWELNDWDKIASGLIAGHIIECGAQSTGGNFTDWQLINKWDNFGYPIVEVFPDSTFVVTKHHNTGGIVTVDTVREQLVYEMGDPSFYISPDVIANFLTIQLAADGENRVKVWGIKGEPSTKTFKVSMAYEDGFSANGTIIISGDNALQKAEIFAKAFWTRINLEFEKTNTEFIGYNACQKSMVKEIEPNEVLLKLSVYDNDKNKLSEFSKGIAPLILSGPPGVAVTGGRPRIQNVMSYWPTLISKELITARVALLDSNGEIDKTETV
ncbi:3-hydroxy-3isohexenylglutaryl-CoA:acetate lyase, partial [hydrothermal vent metagenome]